MFVNFIGVSPFVRPRDNGFVTGHVALKVKSCKVAKHEKTYLKNRHVVTPFNLLSIHLGS
ncbi:hypothetical protein R6Q57_012018 [Mikania cordata]